MVDNIIASIASACGITITGYVPVTGGDINEAYCLYGQQHNYFLKLNHAQRYPGMFALEADGLSALRAASKLLVPSVIKHGTAGDRQWLLLAWLQKDAAVKNTLHDFGAALADMHRQPQLHFGWHNNNYIGSLQQTNTVCDNWADFFTFYRILPLVATLFDKGDFKQKDLVAAQLCCKNVAGWFPEEPPAILHGDLWGGNYMVITDGWVAVFDPAVYFGHREMDIGLTKLFGGFGAGFYAAYEEVYPLDREWAQRLPLAQLYPILVHAVLFGGHYIENARRKIMKWGK